MNWVLLLVLLILGYNIIRGYRKGFLRIVYSLLSWVIVLTFVTVATPYINTYLMEHTTLYEKIEQQCSEQIKGSVEEKQRSIQNESSPDNQKLSQFGIMLPDSVVNDIFEKTGNMAGEITQLFQPYHSSHRHRQFLTSHRKTPLSLEVRYLHLCQYPQTVHLY